MSAAIAEAINAFRASFDPVDGSLHGAKSGQLTCRSCGATLSGPDGPRPAETYAGTYNGLCYSCTGSERYIVAEFHDGAVRWSYPPHCPSWRRNREEFVAYADCEHCSGDGRKMVFRSMSGGGSYPEFCRPCHERFWAVHRSHEAAALAGVVARLDALKPPRTVYGPAYMIAQVAEAVAAELAAGAHAGPAGEGRGATERDLLALIDPAARRALTTKAGKVRSASAVRCRAALIKEIAVVGASR